MFNYVMTIDLSFMTKETLLTGHLLHEDKFPNAPKFKTSYTSVYIKYEQAAQFHNNQPVHATAVLNIVTNLPVSFKHFMSLFQCLHNFTVSLSVTHSCTFGCFQLQATTQTNHRNIYHILKHVAISIYSFTGLHGACCANHFFGRG